MGGASAGTARERRRARRRGRRRRGRAPRGSVPAGEGRRFRVRGRAQGDRPPSSRPRRGHRPSASEGGSGRGALAAAPGDSPKRPVPGDRGLVALPRPARPPGSGTSPSGSSSSTCRGRPSSATSRAPRQLSESGPVPAPRDGDGRHPGRRAMGRDPRALRFRPDDRRRGVPCSRREGRPGRGRALPRGRPSGARRLRVARRDAGSRRLELPEKAGAVIWEELRALPEAAWVALALPRLMLRLPYGRKTDPIESFPFEEIPGAAANEAYLWGNGALGVRPRPRGCLRAGRMGPQARNGRRDPRSARARLQGRLETRVTPPSEVVLTIRAAEKVLEAGLVPVSVAQGKRERACRAPSADRQPAARPRGALAERRWSSLSICKKEERQWIRMDSVTVLLASACSIRSSTSTRKSSEWPGSSRPRWLPGRSSSSGFGPTGALPTWQTLMSLPVPRPSAPTFTPGAGPSTPRPGELSDVTGAIYKLPQVQGLVEQAHDEGLRQLRLLRAEWIAPRRGSARSWSR